MKQKNRIRKNHIRPEKYKRHSKFSQSTLPLDIHSKTHLKLTHIKPNQINQTKPKNISDTDHF
jgi:hypothetical protein